MSIPKSMNNDFVFEVNNLIICQTKLFVLVLLFVNLCMI